MTSIPPAPSAAAPPPLWNELLAQFAAGQLNGDELWQRLRAVPPSAAEGGPEAGWALTPDLERAERCGFPEVVFSPGKPAAVIVELFRLQRERGQSSLATRISPEQAAAVMGFEPELIHNPCARTLRSTPRGPAPPSGRVAVVTAGTSDLPVAEEAVETLRWMQVPCDLVCDVGVAGPQRLQRRLPLLAGCAAVVVVAGMEGALPSVVGGYVACPVVGVPTSVGTGANLGGLAALLSMLNSCAANVTVVNVDGGFKGGYIAGLIARRTAPNP